MKKVLIADSHSLFRDYLKSKLTEAQVEVIFTQNNRELYTKTITTLPSLIILDLDDDSDQFEFLEKKRVDTNCSTIPIIATGTKRNRSEVASLAKYGVIKYFEKPIRFDQFFISVGMVLHVTLGIDSTPCILDLHRTNNIIFLELALGLNRDKIALLRFKLSEIIENEEMENPKIVIMLTNLELTFVDGYNLEFLIDTVLACPKVHNKHVKILSLSPFVSELINGHQNYTEISVSANLSNVLNELVDISATSKVHDLITNRILTPSFYGSGDESIATRFSSDEKYSVTKKNGTVLSIAIIDSDQGSAEIAKNSFETVGASCEIFLTGSSFIKAFNDTKFDLIILDVLLADKTGLSLLNSLKSKPHAPPILVYSPSLQKDIIIKVLSSGAKSYVLKPQKPQVLVQKALALLHS